MSFIIWGGIIGVMFGAILSGTRSDKDIPVFCSVIGFGVLGAIIGWLIHDTIAVISILKFFAAEGAQVFL